ncbi:uncharacterized protein LOC110464920 [Mizuhopecten yessoensis]|uniref:Uncharacterized protein n=1 Tax=Mizuhopecten yessoensis TaxID=6573 RepID=A0A210PST1_MIZYE|nr:uncharacterized protein LOC110464920 [Mizuhopecten yessoensis]OWF39538.1 hypothetical protein KP79_PYT23306 [Mizuhopecten yessoensis]
MRLDTWKRHLLAVVGIPVTVLLLGPLLWMVSAPRDDIYKEKDIHLRRLVRSLHSLEKDRQLIEDSKSDADKKTVSSKVPWLQKDFNKFLPNIYLRKSTKPTIRDSAIVFLQQEFASADKLLHTCLSNISYDKDLPMSPVMHVQNRLLWNAGTKDSLAFKERIKVHRGPYSFGACDKINVKCAHFIMVHDPFELAMSSYEFCKADPYHEKCTAFQSKSVSLREWILLQKGALFYQLLFSPEMCSQDKSRQLKYLQKSQLNSTIHDQDQRNPCWYRQKLLLGQALSDTDIGHITDFIVNHLSDWFAVIGLGADVDSSLEMFEKAFELPFTKCLKSDSGNDLNNNNSYNRASHTESEEDEPSDDYDDDDTLDLRDDFRIQEAMLPDLKIYKEARRLFHIQQQILLNKV